MQSLQERLDSDPKPNYLQFTLDILSQTEYGVLFSKIKHHMEAKYGLKPVNHLHLERYRSKDFYHSMDDPDGGKVIDALYMKESSTMEEETN